MTRKHLLPLRRSSRPSQKPGRVSRGGFTLVELLTVIAVVATLTYLVSPAIASLNQSGNFRANTTQIGQVMEQAYASALARNTYVWVGFSQTTINGQSGVAVASVYSAHENPADFPATVNPLIKPVFLPNLALSTITTQITNSDRATTSVGQVTDASLGNFAAQINGVPQTLSYVVQISPSGQVTASSTSKYAWMEIGLTSPNSNGKNVAVVQMNAFTGRVSTYQP